MNQLKFYSVSDRYIAYLSKHFPNYKDLLITELSFIRRNADKIMKYAHTMYILKHNQTADSPAYIKTALDYKALEILCDAFQQ